MRVKELEKMFGVTRANIRFYEKEGLLKPERAENGYRDYDNEDVERIKKIILFRKLGISIPEIKKILNKENTLSDIVSDNLQSLKEQIEQLQGAVDICNEMLQDDTLDSDFSVDTYWNLMEKKESAGEKFFDYLKDYIKQENALLVAMGAGVFFYETKAVLKKQEGKKIALLIILGLCILRGLATQFLWHEGSFLSGFFQPFLVCVILLIYTFPLYVIERMYAVEEKEKPRKNIKLRYRFLIATAKVIGMVFLFIIMLIGLPVLGEIMIEETLMGNLTNYMVSYPLMLFYYFVAAHLFMVIIWLYGKDAPSGILIKNDGIKTNLPPVIKRRVLAIFVTLFIFIFVINMTCYDCTSENGVNRRRFFWTKEYTWEDAEYFTVYVRHDNSLGYRVVMEDGAKVKLYGEMLSCNFDEKHYPEADYDFVLFLTEKFINNGVTAKVYSWEKLEKRVDDQGSKYLLQEIKEICTK